MAGCKAFVNWSLIKARSVQTPECRVQNFGADESLRRVATKEREIGHGPLHHFCTVGCIAKAAEKGNLGRNLGAAKSTTDEHEPRPTWRWARLGRMEARKTR